MAEHNNLGRDGENAAASYLEDNGYKILDRNWRSGKKEVDIIARKEEEIIFVEVKTRCNNDFAEPEDAVTPQKVRNIIVAANNYIKQYKIDLEPHFDIITAIGQHNTFRIKHLKDAFYSPLF